MTTTDLKIKTLGPCNVKSPLLLSNSTGGTDLRFVEEKSRVLLDVVTEVGAKTKEKPLMMERGGPREYIYFDPSKTNVAIVTCGGLCPGINNVIRSMVMALYYRYGVKNIFGVQYGYQGFVPEFGHPFIPLTPEYVSNIHLFGGTILGSSRGKQATGGIVDCLQRNNINILVTIGGDGTLRGACDIEAEIERRGLKISVVGIPKTIDNDINHVEKTFGFETAFHVASPIIRDAHNEAKGAYNGVAIVKLMGRDSGFIAANAALSMPEVNFVLVPEMDFDLHGEKGLLASVQRRLEEKKHCLIVVAEGAGQSLFKPSEVRKDASGNILHEDIGLLLKDELKAYFKGIDFPATIKYIDPSYIIRSAPANPSDSLFCNKLALHGIHGAMAGKTRFLVGRRNNKFIYLPLDFAIAERKKINLSGSLWLNVIETTGQPPVMVNASAKVKS
jgi:6-phosphofructokinase 1